MIRWQDGSVALRQGEVEEVFAAFDRLYDLLGSQPTSILTCDEYTTILKWRFLLAGAEPAEPECAREEPWEDEW